MPVASPLTPKSILRHRPITGANQTKDVPKKPFVPSCISPRSRPTARKPLHNVQPGGGGS